jgi:hypothetical protein
LVSHWKVASGPTIKLITKAIAELKADPQIGRAEVLRRSMLSMIIMGAEYEAHPATIRACWRGRSGANFRSRRHDGRSASTSKSLLWGRLVHSPQSGGTQLRPKWPTYCDMLA